MTPTEKALREAFNKLADTRAHYEKELSDAKKRRDKRNYELTEVAYLACLREDIAALLKIALPPAAAEEAGKQCECLGCQANNRMGTYAQNHPPAPASLTEEEREALSKASDWHTLSQMFPSPDPEWDEAHKMFGVLSKALRRLASAPPDAKENAK